MTTIGTSAYETGNEVTWQFPGNYNSEFKMSYGGSLTEGNNIIETKNPITMPMKLRLKRPVTTALISAILRTSLCLKPMTGLIRRAIVTISK